MVREIGGKIVAIAVGERSQEFNGMINLNETGRFIWKCLEKDTTVDAVVDKIVNEYGISTLDATQAATIFIDELRKNELIDE